MKLWNAVSFIITAGGTFYLLWTGQTWGLFWFLPLVLIMALVSSFIDSLKYYRLFLAGRIKEAFEEIEKREQKYPKNIKFKNQMKLAKAIIHTNIGKYEMSDHTLKLMTGSLDKNLEGVKLGLLPFNTFMTGGDFLEAREMIHQSMKLVDLPSNFIILANIELELGNKDIARQPIESYKQNRNKRSIIYGRSTLLVNKKLQEPFDNYLLGRYYLSLGETKAAREHFKLASESTLPNLYTELSNKLITDL
ncbi:hypothetical protein NV379_15380 [Paenibacillus sp. N1-5-1-14]|uniref:tetratricopeptide repeat protein n=1 Tax=Paenibacillus radicibacter TaxID=2972488 RepID=UPI0021594306|nr:hypothetical protein [Paenibacillus radicibacter]MCR8644033.1 hypothetical protein [Paenibacillus radicibacter]